jgi:actin-related protein
MGHNIQINIGGSSEGENLIWKGGKNLALSDSFKRLYITKKKFDKYGKYVINENFDKTI